jgi:hypothetical protein
MRRDLLMTESHHFPTVADVGGGKRRTPGVRKSVPTLEKTFCYTFIMYLNT